MKVIILKAISDDEYLRRLGTAAFNYGITNQKLRNIVRKWNEKYQAILLGAANMDSIDLKFPQIQDEK